MFDFNKLQSMINASSDVIPLDAANPFYFQDAHATLNDGAILCFHNAVFEITQVADSSDTHALYDVITLTMIADPFTDLSNLSASADSVTDESVMIATLAGRSLETIYNVIVSY